jgi:hypothetical protein
MEKNSEISAKVFGHRQEISDGPVYPSSLGSMLNFMLNVVNCTYEMLVPLVGRSSTLTYPCIADLIHNLVGW